MNDGSKGTWIATTCIFVTAERVQREEYEMGLGCVWMCLVNFVNPAVDWPPLLHTLSIVTNHGQDDHWVCPHMSPDFDLRLTFDLDKGVNTEFVGYMSVLLV